MLIRNISINDGLCNGTRLKINNSFFFFFLWGQILPVIILFYELNYKFTFI